MSTIRHRASHLRAFFDWLQTTPGYQALRGLDRYFLLPKKFKAVRAAPANPYPTLGEASRMLDAMPGYTRVAPRHPGDLCPGLGVPRVGPDYGARWTHVRIRCQTNSSGGSGPQGATAHEFVTGGVQVGLSASIEGLAYLCPAIDSGV